MFIPALLPAALAAAAPASTYPAPADIAAAVESGFAERDLNGDGTLSRAEFGAWMAELRAIGVRHARADAPETRTWVTAAFDLADLDHDAGVSAAELLAFLAQQP